MFELLASDSFQTHLRRVLEKLKRAAARVKKCGLEDSSGQPSRCAVGIQFFAGVAREFIANRCFTRASALAYTTLLALVPLLAVAISVTTSLLKKQGEKPISEFINALVARVAPQLDLVSRSDDPSEVGGTQEVVSRISQAIGNVRSGALGATSMAALLLVAISLMRTVESAFNDIWKGARDRSFLSSLIQYWAAMTLGPLLLFLVFSLSTGPYLQATKTLLDRIPIFAQVLTLFLLQFVPFVLMIAGLALFYALMPNTQVRWGAALAGGAVGGILWQLNNMLSIVYLSKVMSYKSLYGSLGTLPIFLLGLYISWVILLFGAQVAHSFQHRHLQIGERESPSINTFGREYCALRITAFSAGRFEHGLAAPTLNDIATESKLPPKLANEVIRVLVHHRVLAEVAGPSIGYAPARSLSQIRLADVIHAIRSEFGQDFESRDEAMGVFVLKELEEVRRAELAVAGSVTLEDLVRKMADPPTGLKCPAQESRNFS